MVPVIIASRTLNKKKYQYSGLEAVPRKSAYLLKTVLIAPAKDICFGFSSVMFEV
jgi:hypothetical protein